MTDEAIYKVYQEQGLMDLINDSALTKYEDMPCSEDEAKAYIETSLTDSIHAKIFMYEGFYEYVGKYLLLGCHQCLIKPEICPLAGGKKYLGEAWCEPILYEALRNALVEILHESNIYSGNFVIDLRVLDEEVQIEIFPIDKNSESTTAIEHEYTIKPSVHNTFGIREELVIELIKTKIIRE